MKNTIRKMLAFMLTLVMVFSLMPVTTARASGGTAALKFLEADLADADITYKVGTGSAVTVDGAQADEGGAVWVKDIPGNSNIIITVTPRNENANITGIEVLEGEDENAKAAYNGNLTNNGTVYTYTFEAGDSVIYVVSVISESGGDNPSGDEAGGSSWEEAYINYISPGINIVSDWVGNSEGTITYEYSDDLKNWTSAVKLDRAAVEKYLNTIQDDTASEASVSAAKKALFGLSKQGRYMRIKAPGDFGGNHMGFDVYSKNSNGRFVRQDDFTLKYYLPDDAAWVDYGGYDYRWEEMIKDSRGLILDLNYLDDDVALYCMLPFDSRLSIGWWNAKYKEQVAAAGDHPSDDQWVENGTVEIVSVVSEDGKDVYYSNEPGWEADPDIDPELVVIIGKAGYDRSGGGLRPGYSGPHGRFTAEEMAEAGEYASGDGYVPKNSLVTVKLTPDAGYQILSAQINGMALTPDAGTQSQFTFKMVSNIHFTALFEKSSDVVSVSGAKEVSAATISGTTKVVDTGNLALTVKDDVTYNNSNALSVSNGDAIASLDVAVDQIVAKAGNLSQAEQEQAKKGTLAVTSDKFWTNNLAELNDEVGVSLTLDNVSLGAGESIELVRDHNGKCEKIPVTIKTDNNKVVATFSSDKFSTYTFVKKTHKHSLKKVAAVAATSTKSGNSTYYKCACGKYFSDSKGTKEIAKGSWVIKANKITVTTKYTRNASAKKQTIKLKAKAKGGKLTYKSNNKNVKVSSKGTVTIAKNFSGKAVITIKASGNKYKTVTKKVAIIVNPAKVAISKLTTPKKSQLKVTWKKNSYVTGYQIQYSRDKKFSKSKTETVTISKAKITSKTITKLKAGAKYYVRIRTYKTQSKSNYYSAWSKVKTIRVKK